MNKEAIVVCGSRDWVNAAFIEHVLDGIQNMTQSRMEIVITGGQRGVDTLADAWALKRGKQRIIIPARFEAIGPAAGPERNELMLSVSSLGDPQVVIAFPGQVGTRSMIRLAHVAKVPVVLVPNRGNPVVLLGGGKVFTLRREEVDARELKLDFHGWALGRNPEWLPDRLTPR